VDRAAASVLAVLENAANARGIAGGGSDVATEGTQLERIRTVLEEAPTPGAGTAVWTGMPEAPSAHADSVDVIVCVHDALDDVSRCLDAVLANTTTPYSLILVDDGSQAETRDLLRSFAADHAATLLRNEEALGYTRAANQGMRASSAPLVFLLNSDTVVTPGWLDRLAACATSGPNVGMVGPLSNSATWQSVPEVIGRDTWARNTLSPGRSPAYIARDAAHASDRVYPEVAFLNGFCLMIRRELIDAIGTFDEEHFGRGYGEENDFCMRSRQAGWRLLVADDAYVFHQGSRSYTPDRRAKLVPAAGQALAELHGRSAVQAGVDAMRGDRLLAGIRARISVAEARARYIADGAARWQGRRVAFVLPTQRQGGGANVIILLGHVMRRMGLEVDLVNLEANRIPFEDGHPDLGLPVRYLASPADLSSIASAYDAVVATHHTSVSWLEPRRPQGSAVIRAHLIQDMEAWFFEPGSPDHGLAMAAYARGDELRCFATTDWVRDTVAAEAGVDSLVIGALVDIDRFRPRQRRLGEITERPLRVSAMIRPETPRRGAARTMRVLRALKQEHGAGLEVVIFGSAVDDRASAGLATDFGYIDLGTIPSGQVATLLNECDLFLDLSDWQAMGLTAMEAMACGVTVVVPEQGGASSIVHDGVNGRVVDTRSFGDCLAAARELVADDELRRSLATQALRDVVSHHPERATHALLSALFASTRAADPTEQRGAVATVAP
jgi:GT2 family glycosyltransferase/glycosyltransferase involved in cell wall biosynthesis